MEKISVFERLQSIRVALQNSQLKKSGENPFAHFKYYELDDFLPTINKLMKDNSLISVFNLTMEKAVLEIRDTETNAIGQVSFEVPCIIPELRGTNATQNLGACITYLRRYLFINAFEISENDVSDATSGKPIDKTTEKKASQASQAPADLISEAQAKRLYALCSSVKAPHDKVKAFIKTAYGYDSSRDIKKEHYEAICKKVECGYFSKEEEVKATPVKDKDSLC